MTQERSVADSKSGSNAYTLACDARDVNMQYASCLARIGALQAPGVKVPKDWEECGRCMTHGECRAQIMRAEEVAANRSIYFRERSVDRPRAPAKGLSWSYKPKTPTPKAEQPPARPLQSVPTVATPTLSDAITEMARREAAKKAAPAPEPKKAAPVAAPQATQPAPVSAPKARPPMLPGESPLAYARRIRDLK
jgi:hypothetical protein